MSEVQAFRQPAAQNPVVLAERIAAGQPFATLFREGMTLVELAAAYLDGPGRRESKQLSRIGALTYATESMRLTTRLMQLASWLLLQRAVNEGELTQDQARSEKTKVKLSTYDPPLEETMKSLPKRLRTLIDESRRLHDHVIRMDSLIYGGKLSKTANDNPVEHQLGLLRAAFEAKRSA